MCYKNSLNPSLTLTRNNINNAFPIKLRGRDSQKDNNKMLFFVGAVYKTERHIRFNISFLVLVYRQFQIPS